MPEPEVVAPEADQPLALLVPVYRSWRSSAQSTRGVVLQVSTCDVLEGAIIICLFLQSLHTMKCAIWGRARSAQQRQSSSSEMRVVKCDSLGWPDLGRVL